MKLLNNNKIQYLLLAIGFIAGVVAIFFTSMSYGGGDSTQHYNLAHWGWLHPKLLFNHWGKPVFTILMSPLAQFGINGARIYNLLMGFGTAIIIWKIAEHLKFKNTGFSLLFVLFTPVYLVLMFVPLTEVSYSFFVALSILLFFKHKYYTSAIVLSFSVLIRTEGIVLIPLFIVAYSIRGKWLAIPFLTVGFLLISLLGYQYYDDFWWLITKMPYSGSAKEIYGSGSLFRFVNDSRGILGYPLVLFFIVGLVLSIFNWGKRDNYGFSETFYFLLLIPGSYIIFLSAHSFVWWQGMGNSLGLIRVIGSVTPFAALTALYGFNFVVGYIKKKNIILGSIIKYGIILWIIILGITTHSSGFKLSEAQLLAKQSAQYLKENNLTKHKVYFFDPYVIFSLRIDPYDNNKCDWGVPNREIPSMGVPDSSIIIWDAHFGPNEGRVSLESLQNQNTLTVLQTIVPEVPFTVLGGNNYEIKLFMKDMSLSGELLTNFLFEYETGKRGNSNIAHAGNKSQHILSDVLFSGGVNIYLQEIFDTTTNFTVSVKGYIFVEKPLKNELNLVCSLQDNSSDKYHYYRYNIGDQITKVNSWNYFEHNFKIDSISSKNVLVKTYIWNNHKQDFFLDDFEIDFKSNVLDIIK